MDKTSQRRLGGIAVAGLLVVILGAAGRLGPLGRAFEVVSSPIVQSLHAAGLGLSNNVAVVTSAGNLAKDNAQLRKENAGLRAALATASAGSTELSAIKKQLGLRELAGKRLIPADVMSTQPDSYRSFITINRGSKDGVAAGMAVLVDGNLVGTVSSATSLASKVLVVVDPTFKVTGQVLSSGSGATGTVRGSIGGGLIMEKIPQDQKVATGDTVITSGQGGSIVRGYSLGTIQSITKADNGVFQSAVLSTPVQIGRLQTVFVVGN